MSYKVSFQGPEDFSSMGEIYGLPLVPAWGTVKSFVGVRKNVPALTVLI